MYTTLALGSAVVHKHTSYSVSVKDFLIISASKQHAYKSRFTTEMKEDECSTAKTITETLEQQKSNS